MNVNKQMLEKESSKLLANHDAKTIAEKLVRCKAENELLRDELRDVNCRYYNLRDTTDKVMSQNVWMDRVLNHNNIHKYILKVKEVVDDCEHCRWYGGECPREAESTDDSECITAVQTSLYPLYYYKIIGNELTGVTTKFERVDVPDMVSCIDVETGEVIYSNEQEEGVKANE